MSLIECLNYKQQGDKMLNQMHKSMSYKSMNISGCQVTIEQLKKLCLPRRWLLVGLFKLLRVLLLERVVFVVEERRYEACFPGLQESYCLFLPLKYVFNC